MGMAELVVTSVLVEGRTKTEVAREYGISRRWVITLVQRYQAEGTPGLEPRSRRPRSSPNRTPVAVEDRIIEIRKDLDRDGYEAGAATIAAHLERELGTTPAVSTIWRILTERGFVTPQPHKRPRSSYKRFVAEQPNERWQSDVTHWALPDGRWIEICNFIDDHSRLCLASTARAIFTAPAVDEVFRKAAETWGNPADVLTDNGAVYTGRFRKGRVTLEVTLHDRGITFSHSRPYHPETCGKVERFHQTQKKWLARQPPATTIRGVQAQLDTFVAYYNTVRPHRALGRRTPIDAYNARPKAAPAGAALEDLGYRVRHDIVDDTGTVTLRHNTRLHHIGIGRKHAGRRVQVLVRDQHVRVITSGGELLRDFQLDPDRDYQPQAKR